MTPEMDDTLMTEEEYVVAKLTATCDCPHCTKRRITLEGDHEVRNLLRAALSDTQQINDLTVTNATLRAQLAAVTTERDAALRALDAAEGEGGPSTGDERSEA